MVHEESKTVRVRKDTHKALKLWALQNDMDLNDAADLAVTQFLGRSSGDAAAKVPEPTVRVVAPKTPETARPDLPSMDELLASGAIKQGVSEPVERDGRWRLEGKYYSEIHTQPFYKVVRGGVVRWEDADCDELDEATWTAIEYELRKEKPTLKLKEVEE